MTQVPQGNLAAKQDPAPLLTKSFREINGVFTASSRLAIPEDKVYNLVNIIPIGPQNAEVVANLSGVLFDYSADPPFRAQNVNLNNEEFIVVFCNSGLIHIYSVVTNIDKVINTGGNLSGNGGTRCTQWKNTVILFIDLSGYYAYDGTTFQLISGPGVPASGDDIAVYSGRVWIVKGRLLINSGADDYTAPSFLETNGAAFKSLTDSQIRSKVYRMIVSNGVLYLIGEASVNAVYGVQVSASAVPPTPTYINQNIQAAVGSDQPDAIFAYANSSILMGNKFGAYQVYGMQSPKISDDINGTWQYLDTTKPMSGGQVVVNGILCGAFLIRRKNDPVFGSGTIIALFTQRAAPSSIQSGEVIWWFCDFGAVDFICPAVVKGQLALFMLRGGLLYQVFADPTTAPVAQVMTKLSAMEDDLAAKEVIVAGFSAVFRLLGSSLSFTVDTPSQQFDTGVTVNVSSGLWVNSFGVTGQWQNANGDVGGWFTAGPYLVAGNAPAVGSRYVGLTLNSNGYAFELNLMAMDYKIRQRWLTTG